MRVLLFQHNVHNFEPIEIPNHDAIAVNLTVRKGLKWSSLVVGERIELRDTADPDPNSGTPASRQFARVYDVKVMSFNDLMSYPEMLKLEHDPDCQNYKGLHRAMRSVYDGFLSHELVTLVFYIPDSPAKDSTC